jgi:Glycosidases
MHLTPFIRKPLPFLLAAVLTSACGGGGGSSGGDTPVTPTTYTKTVDTATGTADSRLACYKGNGAGDAACQLRMYQVMVEAFANGDDSINYGVGYGPSDHKGDLQGIINSLDYIKGLGVNAIWLTPVFNSCGDSVTDKKLAATGYYACDYFNVDPFFGTNAKLKELVDTAHAKGLYVFLDGVFGHAITSTLPVAPISGVRPTMKTATTGYTVDYTQANSVTFFTEVATHYIKNYGIDGWRLDQSYQVPVDTWNTIRTAVEDAAAARAAAGETWGTLGYMVGEDWDSQDNIATNTYGTVSVPGLKSAFDFPLRYGLVQALGVEESGTAGDATKLFASWNDGNVYPAFAMPNLMLGNHDLVRFGDLLQRGGLADVGDDAYWLRHKAAFSFMAANSGPITFYYGDEIGEQLDGFSTKNTTCGSGTAWCDDNASRTTGKIEGVTSGFTPSARQTDLKSYLTSLMTLRAAHPALSNGQRTHIFSDANVYIDRKDNATADDRVLFVLNAKTTPAEITLSATALGSADTATLTDLQDSSVLSSSGGNYTITVPALTARFLSISE